MKNNVFNLFTGCLSMFLCLYACQKPPGPIEKPEKTISVKEARVLQNNYISTRGAILKDTFGYEDSREFWYSLEELEEYLAYVKQEAKAQGYEDLGIRIYLAAYEPTKDKEFGLSTIFLTPTGKKIVQKGNFFSFLEPDSHDENIYSISPLNDNQSGWPPKNY